MNIKFVVIVPFRNEIKNIEKTITSLLKQTVKPVLSVFVDDGSTDGSDKVVMKYKERSSMINYIRIKGTDKYLLGGHVVSVFSKGKTLIDQSGTDYDYIVKLDADISFKKNFFADISKVLQKKTYGIISGTPYYMEGGKKIYDRSPEFHARGQFKFYNKNYLQKDGCIPEGLGWDTADNIKAIFKGWETARLNKPEYMMHRQIGSKHSLIRGRIRHGMGAYNLRYSILYLLVRTVHDLFRPPLIIGSFCFASGYLKSLFQRQKHVLTREEGKLLRRLLWKELFKRLNSGDFYLTQKIRNLKKNK